MNDRCAEPVINKRERTECDRRTIYIYIYIYTNNWRDAVPFMLGSLRLVPMIHTCQLLFGAFPTTNCWDLLAIIDNIMGLKETLKSLVIRYMQGNAYNIQTIVLIYNAITAYMNTYIILIVMH